MERPDRSTAADDERADPRALIPIVVLAAGAGARMTGAAPPHGKLAVVLAGQSLLGWTLQLARRGSAASHPLILVVRAGQQLPDDVGARTAAQIVVAEHAGRGMAWSLRAGLDACPRDARGVCVVLADDPLAALDTPRVLAAARRGGSRPVAIRRTGRAPHPVYIPAGEWRSWQPAADGPAADQGLRELLSDGDTCWLEAAAPDPIDLDRPEDVPLLERALVSWRDAPRRSPGTNASAARRA